jgi:hypothetical protein
VHILTTITTMYMSSQSLKTIDKIVTSNLLGSKSTTSSQCSKRKKVIFNEKTLSNNRHIISIPNFFSHNECSDIIKKSNKIGFSTVDSYERNKRDSDRLCVLDNNLAMIIWHRMKDLKIMEKVQSFEMVPYGFETNGKWMPKNINECMRISKYESGSKGFVYHYDSQYCKDIGTKSIMSVIIYLNDDFVGGNTIFRDYRPKDIDKNSYQFSANLIKELPVDLEIKLNGGIKNYSKHTLKPKKGMMVLFNHDILHCADELKTGNKYLLRTDIIFHKTEHISKPMSCTEKKDYVRAIEYFREAQNQELDGNVKLSSELYEKSNSIRKSYGGKANRTNNSVKDGKSVEYCKSISIDDHWKMIYEYVNLEDMFDLAQVCKMLYALSKIVEKRYWIKCAKKYYMIKTKEEADIIELEEGQSFDDYYSQHFSKKFMPNFIERDGSYCYFEYSNVEFYKQNREALLRATAIYSMYMFGHTKPPKVKRDWTGREGFEEERTTKYIANYDTNTKQVLGCSLEWLVGCSYYEIPLHGKFYHVDNVRQELYNENLPSIKRNLQNQDKTLQILQRWNDDDDFDNYWFETNIPFSHIPTNKYLHATEFPFTVSKTPYPGIKILKKDLIENNFNVFDKNDELTKIETKIKTKIETEQNSKFNPMCSYFLVDDEMKYQIYFKCTFHPECEEEIGAKYDYGRIEKETKKKITIKQNNLIFDFEKNKINIKAVSDNSKAKYLFNNKTDKTDKTNSNKSQIWLIDISELDKKSFNHAGCDNGYETYIIKHTYKPLGYESIDNIYILEEILHDKVSLITHYNSVNTF